MVLDDWQGRAGSWKVEHGIPSEPMQIVRAIILDNPIIERQ